MIWEGGMTLGQLVAFLRELPEAAMASPGFGRPHSYRGYYECVAFEPDEKGCTAAELLHAAESAMGQTYSGWKGGSYTMDEGTECYIAEMGATGSAVTEPLLRSLFTDAPSWWPSPEGSR